MKILVINPGSTSVKCTLFKNEEKIESFNLPLSNETIQKALKHAHCHIDVFGLRIVHGGSYFTESTWLDLENLKKVAELGNLAPLHNPVSVKVAEQIFAINPNAKILGAFDTTFHSTLSENAWRYAIPKEIADPIGVRKYGFHGTVCANIVRQIYEKKGHIPEKLIVAHLGGGCSVTAIKNGKSVDTSMGFTPLEGLMMMSRCGDMDPSIPLFLQQKLNLTPEEVDNLMNKKSGVKGFYDTDNLGEIVDKAKAGDADSILIIEMYVRRIAKYIASYMSVLGGLDLLTFSGGTGENSAEIRQMVCDKLNFLNFETEVVNVSEEHEIALQIIEKSK